MNTTPLKIILFGTSIISSWKSVHAPQYRGIARGLKDLGHEVVFFEREEPQIEQHRDFVREEYVRVEWYRDTEHLADRWAQEIRCADAVLIGSGVEQAAKLAEWILQTAEGVTLFYDMDPLSALLSLEQGQCGYAIGELMPRFDMYLSSVGGELLERVKARVRPRRAAALYLSADTETCRPLSCPKQWDLGFLGNYREGRQDAVNALLLAPAALWQEGTFVIAGGEYPVSLQLPANLHKLPHVTPSEHSQFYNRQRFSLHATCTALVQGGYCPSARLFEAAACGTPLISDYWKGLENFFELGKELLIASSREHVLHYLRKLPEEERVAVGARARTRVLARHTAFHRAQELSSCVSELLNEQSRTRDAVRVHG